MNTVLELKNISMKYHEANLETEAIKTINFSVEEGEFISIVGPSGCGKSTLLSIISGLIKPSFGEVLISAKTNTSNVSTGYMLQKDHLFEWRNILRNAILGLEIKGTLKDDNINFSKKLLEQYGLGDFLYHKPSQLSGGMRQRVALIRTLSTKPDILLLDEPFSALDYQTRLYVADEIATIIRKEKKTAILVTHDIAEAISVSDRIIVLTKRPSTVLNIHIVGLSNATKTPMEAREDPRFREYFNKIWKEMDVHE